MTYNEHPEIFIKRSSRYISDWLLDGFIKYYVDEATDAFYPYSSFGANGDPLYALLRVYDESTAKIQTKIRSAVESLALLVVPDSASARIRAIDSQKRLQLLSIVSTAVSETGCFGSVPRLIETVTTNLELWGNPEHKKLAFAFVLRCLIDLSINAKRHSSFSSLVRNDVESLIIRLVISDQFIPQYAAKAAHALISIAPETFFNNYLNFIAPRLLRMHQLNPEERHHAHATADIIAERLPKQLATFAPKMKVIGHNPRDAWMLLAWDNPHSNFEIVRSGGDASVITLKRRITKEADTVRAGLALRNLDFSLFELHTPIRLSTFPGNMAGRNDIELVFKLNELMRPNSISQGGYDA